MMTRVGIVQLNGSDKPSQNIEETEKLIRGAANAGALFIATPEVSNIIGADRDAQLNATYNQAEDPFLEAMRLLAAELSVWISIGSLVLHHESDQKLVNRSFIIGSDGTIQAQYDKIHMFDVHLSDEESYSESKHFKAGERATLTDTNIGKVGMTVCYDIRFGSLYRNLANAGAEIFTIPCAFTNPTGAAHFETLMRARAIENGCFVIAACQTGVHNKRKTYGHSMVVDPWGQILLDAGTKAGYFCVDCDMKAVQDARQRVPSLYHDRDYEKPKYV